MTPPTILDYYDRHEYMSWSQLKRWIPELGGCPAAAHAEYVARTWKRKGAECMGLGALLHAVVLDPDDTDRVLEEYREHLHTAKGVPTAGHKRMLQQGAELREHPLGVSMLDGAQCEGIYTFELGGVPWKMRVDIVNNRTRRIVDLKRMGQMYRKQFSEYYMAYVDTIDLMHYYGQMSLYQTGLERSEGETMDIGIWGATPPDAKTGEFDTEYFSLDNTEKIEHYARMTREWNQIIAEWKTWEPRDLPRCDPYHASNMERVLPRDAAPCGWCRNHRESYAHSHIGATYDPDKRPRR